MTVIAAEDHRRKTTRPSRNEWIAIILAAAAFHLGFQLAFLLNVPGLLPQNLLPALGERLPAQRGLLWSFALIGLLLKTQNWSLNPVYESPGRVRLRIAAALRQRRIHPILALVYVLFVSGVIAAFSTLLLAFLAIAVALIIASSFVFRRGGAALALLHILWLGAGLAAPLEFGQEPSSRDCAGTGEIRTSAGETLACDRLVRLNGMPRDGLIAVVKHGRSRLMHLGDIDPRSIPEALGRESVIFRLP